MNTHLKQLWAAMKLPKNFKKSYKFFCLGLDIRVIDEMTSSLDIETTDEMVKLILSLSCTVIMITHDIFDSYMDGFSAIYYIENGGIAESGTYQRLLEQNGNFAKMQAMMKITNK